MKWLRAAYFCVRGKTSFAASRLAPSEDAQDRHSTGLTADDGDWQRRISAPSAEVPGPRLAGDDDALRTFEPRTSPRRDGKDRATRRGGTRCRNQGGSGGAAEAGSDRVYGRTPG